jgi:hypothetical protein
LVGSADPGKLPEATTMTDVGIDPDGEAVWRWIVHDVGAMLLQLLGEPAAKVAEHVEIPAQKGVYLFSHGDRTVMVGLANDLKRELHAAVTPDAEGGSTCLSFYLARWMAKHSGVNVERDRRRLETDPDFAAHYRRAKQIVPNLVVRFIVDRDLVQRQVLALYSESHLNSAIPSGRYRERTGLPHVTKFLPADRPPPSRGGEQLKRMPPTFESGASVGTRFTCGPENLEDRRLRRCRLSSQQQGLRVRVPTVREFRRPDSLGARAASAASWFLTR